MTGAWRFGKGGEGECAPLQAVIQLCVSSTTSISPLFMNDM